MTCTIFHVCDVNTNKIYMIDIENISLLCRDHILMNDGIKIDISWDAYPFLDKAFKEKEFWESKIGNVVKNVI